MKPLAPPVTGARFAGGFCNTLARNKHVLLGMHHPLYICPSSMKNKLVFPVVYENACPSMPVE